MNGFVALLGLCGLGVGVGLLVLFRAWRTSSNADQPAIRRWPGVREVRGRRHLGRWLALAGAVGLLIGAVTGWVVGGLLAAMAAWSLPRILGSTSGEQERTARIEGIAGWTEMLRDTLAAAAGLEQTILATARTAPKAIRPQIEELAERLERGERLAPSLRHLADDLADPSADLVIAALILASEHQARQLASLLGELAATARAQVEMRQRVEASRARTRTTMRVVVITTLSFASGLILLNPTFLRPYDSATGQLVLLVIGALFTVAFIWLRRMARLEEPDRFLTGWDAISSTAGRGDAAGQEVSP
ncbi:type II secretion system F family protein [Streptantibioticus ferralitis]|uniref:Type II secretion system F family protein n=1 Tax=Streptantibioticus ferralitis TaxID=236510 RepID=A0ABT5Z3H5_9ACTN|nr:type II secretion system F family protein [Streptantibioticus ferralitis]MDF2258381.1 type II secretion system F family protein [Streptantibioticus ferralitis]